MTADPSGAVACRQDPERWFDRDNRTYALERCLACLVRTECAQLALQRQATFGMWAGVWIDGRLDDVAHYLRAIAEPTPAAVAEVEEPAPAADPTPLPRERWPSPAEAGSPRPKPARRERLSYRALVLARADGHCEIMAAGCRLTADGYGYRTPEVPDSRMIDPACVYLRCTECAHAIAAIDSGIAQRLGYLVPFSPWVSQAPFFWRQSRWVQFASDGRLHDVAEAVA